jgi:hypothetical protein
MTMVGFLKIVLRHYLLPAGPARQANTRRRPPICRGLVARAQDLEEAGQSATVKLARLIGGCRRSIIGSMASSQPSPPQSRQAASAGRVNDRR